eukprot:gene30810-35841_t
MKAFSALHLLGQAVSAGGRRTGQYISLTSLPTISLRWNHTPVQAEEAKSNDVPASPAGSQTTEAGPAHADATSQAVPSSPAGSQPNAAGPAPGDATSQADAAPNGYSIMGHMTNAKNDLPLASKQYSSSIDDKFGVQKNWFTVQAAEPIRKIAPFPRNNSDTLTLTLLYRFGVQKNWFTALYKQLNYAGKTGQVPQLTGRQRIVFETVESEFEILYARYVRDKALDEGTHRAMLMACLAVATHRVLIDEIGDPIFVRDVIRTNLGGMMMNVLLPLHRFRIWILRRLLGEHPYKQAVSFLPAIMEDMGSLCESEVSETGVDESTLTVSKCVYHEILTKEDTPFLLSDFCCHHALVWMSQFRRHGLVVSMDECKAWDDSCCKLRVGKTDRSVMPPSSAAEGADK